MKIANDVRGLASGPRRRIGEFFVPENEPGSSIMPGKVNPLSAKRAVSGAWQPGRDCIQWQPGESLNVFKPVIIHNFLHSVRLLTDVSGSFLRHCLTGIDAGRRKLAVPTVRS